MNPQAKELIWDKVRDEKCTRCSLHKEAQSVCLLGEGPVPSRVLLVGEAPGRREDDIARPFSGVAGQYLDRILEEVGLPRSTIYITNSVRCRPPENRTPTRSEIKACSGFMQSELEIVNPEFVLVLGNVALQAIRGTSGIMSKRGFATKENGRTVFATVHPAAVLRNPAHEGIFKNDLMNFSRLVKGQDSRLETKTALIQSEEGLRRLCNKLATVETPIAFDVETGTSGDRPGGGLEPWAPDGVIHTIAFCWEEGKSYVVAPEHPMAEWDVSVEMVYSALGVALAGKRMVGHNIKFDAQWLLSKGVEVHSHFDTKLAAHLLDENRPSGLKPLARYYLGAEEWEAGINFDTATGLKKLAIYNGKDADYTLRLYHILKSELKKQPRLTRLFMKLTMPACRAFTAIEMTGFPVDMERLEIRHAEILDKIKSVEKEMMQYVSKELAPSANFRSPVFLARWFFEELRLPILAIGVRSNRPSTAESVLLKLRSLHPAIALLMELRKWQKYESTYTRNWLARVAIAGKPRLYTSYNLSGTVTGRLSSNMQQVPRDVYIRAILGTAPGWKFIEADFSQVELRIAAMLSGDPALTKAFQTGGDPHRETAARVLGKAPETITKEERKMAKAINFGFLYGMGAKKFKIYADEKYDIKVTDGVAQAYRKSFFEQYTGLLPWHDRCRRLVRSLQVVQSPIGRCRHLPSIASTDEGVQAEAEREAINAPVQGFASDLTVLSMSLLQEQLDHQVARIIGNVHDSILFEVREDFAESMAEMIKNVMEHLPLQALFGYSPRIPIEVDVTISSHWGEKED